MTVTFENDKDVIVYALEKIISYARKSQQIFVSQCVYWLASVIGLELGLIAHIDNIPVSECQANPVKPTDSQETQQETVLGTPVTIQEQQEDSDSYRRDRVLKECEEFIRDSRRL